MIFHRKPRRAPTLNIIPLIDVLVVLLIFYIATTVFKKSEPKINIVVPNSTRAKASQEAVPSTLFVDAEGKLYLEDTPVEDGKLADLLKSKLATNPQFKVVMKADEKAPFSAIVGVMDAAHDAGITDLGTYASPKAATP